MKYYWLSSRDGRKNNWLLFQENGAVALRARYSGLSCTGCGKVDELAAIRLGLDSDILIRSRFDFVRCNDGFICVSAKLRDVIEQQLAGVQCVGLARGDYSLLVPTHFASVRRKILQTRQGERLDFTALAANPQDIRSATRKCDIDVDSCGMEFYERCATCGRYAESLFWPKLSSIEIGDAEQQLVAPDVVFETVLARDWWFLASERAVSVLRNNGISGIEYRDVT